MYNKIKDYKDLVKDKKTGAILLNSQKVAHEYLSKRKELEHDTMVENEINTLKNEMQEIKSLLKELINK